ncbi:lariat debranching enzyme isoform X3 [Setaria viridis]|uniref:lariat debranching enzyme isoform X3 n=1 Tax=Setaria viridis TaxID=4556 RepID=UPI0014932A2E|nr:lariat debranching enzyme-like isoform X3 [Setaria viridis]
MKIAVEGCMHGELDIVYDTLRRLEEAEWIKIDLLLCCGDFQAVRNTDDLRCVNVPLKYRNMNSFWKYYSGQAVAPYPTIFIGGNHEASNYLWELYYGGWAAPNIYFLGFAGVVKFGNIRIGGLSGIHKQHNYHSGHYERPPYNEQTIRSVYHVNNRTLGSKPAAELLNKLKPPYWFSAHLHCRFPAIIQHGENGPTTKFLALDKCFRGRNFLQVIDIPSNPGPYEIHYDEEWLAITRRFNSVFPLTQRRFTMRDEQLDTQDDRQWVRSKLNARGFKPFDFVQTAPSFNPSNPVSNSSITGSCRNPQTESFLQLLELPYLLDSSNSEGVERNESSSQPGNTLGDEDIELPDEDEDAADDDE